MALKSSQCAIFFRPADCQSVLSQKLSIKILPVSLGKDADYYHANTRSKSLRPMLPLLEQVNETVQTYDRACGERLHAKTGSPTATRWA